MKIFLCLLLIKVCSCIDSEPQSNNDWRGMVNDDGNYGHQQSSGPIVRPCSIQDVNCIRQFFARISQCSPGYGPAPDPLRIEAIPMSIPHVNMTFVLYETEVTGFNDFKIKEFYLNQKTDRLVLEIEFQRIFVYSPLCVITFHRKGMEPFTLSDYAFIEYKDLSFTLVVPNIRDIDLSKGHVYTYIPDKRPRQGLGPNFKESEDPQVHASIHQLLKRLGLSVQEAFVTKGPILFSAFLQNSICSQ